MSIQRRFFRANRASSATIPGVPSRKKKIVKPILLTIGLSGFAIVLMDGISVDGMIQNKMPTGGDSITVVKKVPAGDPSGVAGPVKVLAEYASPAMSSSRALTRASTGAMPIGSGASASKHPTTVNATANTVRDSSPAPATLSFGVGDKLKIAFYERLDVEADKWGRPSSALRGIQQRPELSGEYTVQEDGTISIPLLGSIAVTNRSEQQVHAALDKAFAHLLGREGMVNVVLLERAPIYVLGPVKNPGSFKYVPGATVLHAIAMAGGLDRGPNDPWTKVEAVREIQKRSGAAGTVVKLIARDAVLKAERDGQSPRIPLRLIDMVGVGEATRLVNEQSDRRRAIVQARKDRERAMTNSVESAKQDLLMYGHTTILDKLVKTRQERVDNTRALVERNIVAKSMLSQVEGELSDAEQRRQDAINQYGMAKQRLASLVADKLKVQADIENDLAVEIDAVERQIADNERELNTSEGILKNLPITRVSLAPSQKANGVTYQIVRRTATGPINIAADGMTLLQPGDLVDITVGTGGAAGSPAAVSPSILPATATPDEGLPVGRNVNNREIGRTIAQE